MINFILRYPYCFPTLLGALFGLLFPVNTVFFMLWHDQLAITWNNIAELHHIHFDLIIMWSAPVVLAFFGGFIGKTSWLLKQKMDTLEQQTTQLNNILDIAARGIITIDNAGTVLSFNKAAERIFDYGIEEIIGKNVSCLMTSNIAEQHDTDLQRTNILGRGGEVEARRKNGDIFPAFWRVNPMVLDGKLFFSGVIDDISETKILQDQLVQAQKLEAIGQLAAGIAHEINTPIQFIGDNLSALGDNFADIIAFQQELTASADDAFKSLVEHLHDKYDLEFILEDSPKAIQQAIHGVERVAEIVKAMKTFAHVEVKTSSQRINLHETLNNALIISRNTYKYHAEIETDFAADTRMIECYPNELNQVFLNLIVNAAHAIEEKKSGMGLIRITTRKLDDWIEILIQDNGAGISEENREKVFNLFFTTKGIGKGTGQGLSLSHSIIVEKHHGKLFFESTSGKGTTFHIQLPIDLNKQESSS